MSVSALENLHLLERSYAFDAVRPPTADNDYVRWAGYHYSGHQALGDGGGLLQGGAAAHRQR
jgi:hypothetical protein